MPNKDRTGPQGQGPMTGRQMGNCNGAEPNVGRGLARGRGFGRGRFLATAPTELTEAEEKKILEAEKQEIEKRLKEIKTN